MLEHQEPNSQPAAQVRVKSDELISALAAIEARQAQRGSEQAGTLILAEALEQYDIDVSPEELRREVETVREAEARQARTEKQKRRRRLIFQAEVASAALFLGVLFCLTQTVDSPRWQVARQAAMFQQNLALTLEPTPKYHIFVVPDTFDPASLARNTYWNKSPMYPLSSVPDGYDIHHFDALDEGENVRPFSMPTRLPVFEFVEPSRPHIHEMTSVRYNGQYYRRGWILTSDVAHVRQGHLFNFYPAPSLTRRWNH